MRSNTSALQAVDASVRGRGRGRGRPRGSGAIRAAGRTAPSSVPRPTAVDLKDRQYFHCRTAVPMTFEEVVSGEDTDHETDLDEFKVGGA